MFNGIDFTQNEFLWLLLLVPVLAFWYVLKHKKQTAQLSISSVQGFQENAIWSALKHSLIGIESSFRQVRSSLMFFNSSAGTQCNGCAVTDAHQHRMTASRRYGACVSAAW